MWNGLYSDRWKTYRYWQTLESWDFTNANLSEFPVVDELNAPLNTPKVSSRILVGSVQESWTVYGYHYCPQFLVHYCLEQEHWSISGTRQCTKQQEGIRFKEPEARSTNLPVEVFLPELVTHRTHWRTLRQSAVTVEGWNHCCIPLQKLLQYGWNSDLMVIEEVSSGAKMHRNQSGMWVTKRQRT